MDIMRKLQSILAPSAGPVNRTLPAAPAPATPSGGQSFAKALRDAASLVDPSIGTFGVLERLPGSPAGLNGEVETQGPTILPEIPTEPIVDLPIDSLHIEIRDTLESMVAVNREPEVPAQPEPSQLPGVTLPRSVEARPRAESPNARVAMSLPPTGVRWPAIAGPGAGLAAPGVASTGTVVIAMIQLKFDYYTDPIGHGVSEGDEGRMFLDAVNRGYVDKTPEGLSTLLAWNSIGDYDRDLNVTGRPPEISNYFSGWYRGTLPT